MMRYQRAFEGTSKVLQAIDQTMQTIINMIN